MLMFCNFQGPGDCYISETYLPTEITKIISFEKKTVQPWRYLRTSCKIAEQEQLAVSVSMINACQHCAHGLIELFRHRLSYSRKRR